MKDIVDYYSILGVSFYATSEEIKESYRIKVKQSHPDTKNGDSQKFKLILEAYEVLSNEEKRKRYDEILFRSTRVNVLSTDIKEPFAKPTTEKQKTSVFRGKMSAVIISSLITTAIIISIGIYLFEDNNFMKNQTNNIAYSGENLSVKDNNEEIVKVEDEVKDYIEATKVNHENFIKDFNSFAVSVKNRDYDEAINLMGSIDTSILLLLSEESSGGGGYWLEYTLKITEIGRTLKTEFATAIPFAYENSLIAKNLDVQLSLLQSKVDLLDKSYNDFKGSIY